MTFGAKLMGDVPSSGLQLQSLVTSEGQLRLSLEDVENKESTPPPEVCFSLASRLGY